MFSFQDQSLSLAPSEAITPLRLAWLCQPEQIEHTLRLLYFLNAWKKAHQRLLYADRQGLCEIQALVLAQATRMDLVQAVSYLDGTSRFPEELLLAHVAEHAARGVLIHLRSLCDPEIWPPSLPEGDHLYQQYLRPLCRRITGKDCKQAAEAAAILDLSQIRTYIQERVLKLVARARLMRQPLSTHHLAALCIAPVDLLPIRDNRVYFLDSYTSWNALDASDRRKLDPEGASKVAFQYRSATAEFVFHLPMRRAEAFLSDTSLRTLQKAAGMNPERGFFQGKEIGEQEGLAYPVQEILQDLGVMIACVCPHKLIDKTQYLARPAIRDLRWPTLDHDPSVWIDDPWDGLCLPPEIR